MKDSNNSVTLNSGWVPGNDSSQDSSEEFEYIFDIAYVKIIFIFLYTVVFCFCFFGNLAVVLVVTLHWRMRSITKFCLGNLAFANFCVAIFCVYQNLSLYLMDRWVFGYFMCKMYHFINSLSHTASILILVVICGERYLAILDPFRCRRILTITRLRILIVTVWIISAIVSSPRLYYITTYNIPKPTKPGEKISLVEICAPQRNLYDTHTSDMIYFVILFIFPLTAMSVLYTHMGIVLWRSVRVTTVKVTSGRSSDPINSIRRVPESVSSLNVPQPKERGGALHRPNCFRKKTRPARKHNFGVLTKKISSKRSSPSVHGSDTSSRKNSDISSSSERCGNKRMCCKIFPLFYIEKTLKSQTALGLRDQVDQIRGSNFGIEDPQDLKLSPGRPALKSEIEAQGGSSQNSTKRKSLIRGHSHCGISNIQNLCGSNKSISDSRRAVVRMLIVVVVTFAICNLPFHLRKICQNYLPNYDFGSHFSYLLTPLTFLLMYANCAVNPILYGFMSKSFRASLKDLFKCKLQKHFESPIVQFEV